MSTTQTIVEATSDHANSLTMRSQSNEQEDDTVSQESYSTVAGTFSPSGSGPDSQQAKQKKEDVANKKDDSDADEEDPSPCGRCRKMVIRGDEALTCDICEQWFHIKCERVTKTQYKQQATKGKSNFHWFCDTCNIIQSGVIKQLTILKTEHSQLKERIDNLEETKASKEELQNEIEKKADKEDTKKLEQRVTTLEEKQGSTGVPNQESQGPSTSGTNQAEEVIKEIKEQDERKLNVIIFNLAESSGEDNQDKHDKEEVKEIGKICQANIKKDDITGSRRLGKKNDGGKPRPLLITLINEEKKKALFINLKKLQTAPDKYKKISVRHDLTPKQQENEKALREEAKKMEAELSGKEKCLVRGPPWARKIVKVPAQKKSN